MAHLLEPGRGRSRSAHDFLHAESTLLDEADRLPSWLASGQAVLISFGLFGTFLGLTYAVLMADAKIAELIAGQTGDVNDAISAILGGAKLAFLKSMAGIGAGTLWAFRYRILEDDWEAQLAAAADKLDKEYPITADQVLAEHAEAREQERRNDERARAERVEELVRAQIAMGATTLTAHQQTQKLFEGHIAGARRHEVVLLEILQTSAGHQRATTNALAPLKQVEAVAADLAEANRRLDALSASIHELGTTLPTNFMPSLEPLVERLVSALRVVGEAQRTFGSEAASALQGQGGAQITQHFEQSLQDYQAGLKQMREATGHMSEGVRHTT
jgi:hypothetical protein